MASIVLGTVGTAVGFAFGGPVGGMLGGMLGSALGGFIDNATFSRHVTGPKLQDLHVTSATYGAPIPIAYGATRLPGQLIYSSQLREVDVNSSSSGGGKGGPSVTTTTATYYLTCAVAICAGPITDILRIWADGQLIYDNRSPQAATPQVLTPGQNPEVPPFQNYTATSLAFYLGTETQNPDPTLETIFGAGQVPGYRGTAYIVFNQLLLTQFNNHVPNFTFEVIGAIDQTYNKATPYNLMSLAGIVSDLCERAGLSAGQIDVSGLAGQFVPGYVINNESTARNALSPLHQIYFFDGTESDWLLKFKFQDGVSVGSIAENDLGARADNIGQDVDKVTETRIDDVNLPQQVVLRYPLADIDYQVATQQAKRPASVVHSKQYNAFNVPITMSPTDARAAMEKALYLAYVGRLQLAFSAPRTALQYDPTDVVTLTYNNGATTVPCYLQQVDVGADEVINFQGVATDEPAFTTALPSSSPNAATQSLIFPGQANAPLIFEPPDALGGGLTVWVGASGGSNWGGADVFISSDDETYTYLGTIRSPCRQGVLTATLPTISAATTGQTIDTTNQLTVDLSESGGTLSPASISDALAYNTLCYVDGELLSYENASLTSGSTYDLSYLVRGAYGSTIGAHIKGTQFGRLDGTIVKYPFTQDRIGQRIYLKFLSFNKFGALHLTLEQAVAYSYVLQGSALASPLPDVTDLTSVFIAGLTQLNWAPVSDFRHPIDYEIRQGTSWASAQFVGRTPNTSFILQGGDGTYWVAAHCRPVTGLDVYSADPVSITIAGATLVRNVVKTTDEAGGGWTGTLSGGVAISGPELVTSGNSPFLNYTDFLGTSDFLFNGNAIASGSYTSTTTVNTGRVEASYVTISFTAQGSPINGDFLGLPDFLGNTDLLGNALSANISVTPQIRTADASGVYGAWQNYQPGQYNAQYFQVRLLVATNDAQTQAIISAFSWTIDMPDRLDVYTNVAIPAGGLTLSFKPLGSANSIAFNGGPGGTPGTPGLPAIDVTWLNQSGDTLSITGLSLSQVTIQILNGGVGVARTAQTIRAQGY